MKRLALIALICARGAGAAPFDDEPLVRALRGELARSMAKLELAGGNKPFYLAYGVWDRRSAHVEASFGAIVRTGAHRHRFVDIDLRVGDPAFDNSNGAEDRERRDSFSLPPEDDYDAIRRELWLVTDAAYKHAVDQLERKKAAAKDRSPDDAASFSAETASHVIDPEVPAAPEAGKLEPLAKKLSAVFRGNADIHASTVTIDAEAARRYFVSSEGAGSTVPEKLVRVEVAAQTQADDGMPLRDAITFWADTPDHLPPEAEMVAAAEKLSQTLSALRKAPVVDDYAGPVVFTGAAAGQVVRALLADELAGTPAPRGGHGRFGETELAGKVGQRILPSGVSVIDDATATRAGAVPLYGGYRFDEEGIPPQKMSLVENGTFKRFLMSRTPRKGFEHSTGHGRSTPMVPVRAHPANLIVSSTKAVADRDLVPRALAMAREQDLKYVLVVERLASGDEEPFSMMSMNMGRADGALPRPAVMRRVYADGKTELVRGAAFGDVTLRSLKDLAAIGTAPAALHYYGSGLGGRFDAMYSPTSGYPVTIACPALVFRDLDVKKPTEPPRKPPIAPRP